MSLLELQIDKNAFIDFFVSEFNRRRLPFPSSNLPLLPPEVQGAPLERFECVGASIVPTSGEDRITVDAEVVLHYHNNLAEVRAAGSLVAAPTHQFQLTLAFTVSVAITAPPGQPPTVTLQATLPLGILPPASIPLPIPADFSVAVAAVVASETVVAVRLGSQALDNVTGPVTDRLATNDWVFLVSGAVLTDILVANLQSAANEVAQAGDVDISRNAAGNWMPPAAIATVELAKVDACVLGIDVYVELTLTAQFQFSGASLVQTVTLEWDADSTLCDIVVGFIVPVIGAVVSNVLAEDRASQAVLGASLGPPGFQEISRSDDDIVYQRTSFLGIADPRFVFSSSSVTADGLIVRGSLQLQVLPRGLEGEVTLPASELDRDCTARRVTVAFRHPKVTLRNVGGGPPALFPTWTVDGTNALFDPPNAWVAVPGTGNSWLDLVVNFLDPPSGRLPAGTPTSVFLYTDYGVRWVDLGVVPSDHPQPTDLDIAAMLSVCMSHTHPFTLGLTELQWLVDPPDVLHGIVPVRQWTIGFRDLPGSVPLEVIAVNTDGNSRSVATLEQAANTGIVVYTGADETLQIRAQEPINVPPPVVSQRWIAPLMTVPLQQAPVAVSASNGVLGVVAADGSQWFVDASVPGAPRVLSADDPAAHPVVAAMGEQILRVTEGRSAARLTAHLDKRTVGLIFDGQLLIGTIGPTANL